MRSSGILALALTGVVCIPASGCGDDAGPPPEAGGLDGGGVDAGADARRDAPAPTDAGGGGCPVAPRPGCCFADDNCAPGERCYDVFDCRADGEGVCKAPVAPPMCWSDADCGGGLCDLVSLCGCGLDCLVPDTPGSCADT